MSKPAPKFKLFVGDTVLATRDLDMGFDGIVSEGTLGVIIAAPQVSGNWHWVRWRDTVEGNGPVEGYHGPNSLGLPIEERKTWPK